MLKSPEFKELLSIMVKHSARYLVVGGYDVMRYSEPRFTKDLDLWIANAEKNAGAVFRAMKEFGAPLEGLTAHDFTQEGYFYQMGMPPLRVDIMMSIPGVEFETAWKNRELLLLDGVTVPFISRADLIRNKEASGRPQDLLDAENLRKAGREPERDK